MLEMADRQMATTHVLFLDVDNVKQLNDAHGHSTGDAALRAVARAFGAVLRRADAAARIGGDEFVALALEMRQSDPGVIEQRLRGHLRGASTVAAVGHAVEVSVGWATRAPCESKTLEYLLVEADAAMYRAKGLKARLPRT
jgi:diguanylate cyclase (GGDEF)-like protein